MKGGLLEKRLFYYSTFSLTGVFLHQVDEKQPLRQDFLRGGDQPTG